MLSTLARWCFRNPWLVVGGWVLALVVIFGAAFGAVGPAFDASFEIPDSESRRGFDALDDHFGGFGSGQRGSIVFSYADGVDDPAVKGPIEELLAEVGTIDGVTVSSPYERPFDAIQVSADGRVAFAELSLSSDLDFTETADVGAEIKDLLPEIDGLQVEIGGEALAEFETPETEFIGLSFAVVVLIIAFGSVLAMGLPLGTAITGVGVGIGLTTLISNLIAIPDFATFIAVMIGLGVGIDYALFIVTRYREGLHAGKSAEDATVAALDSAGRAVIFAGLTVVISLMGMLIIGLSSISGMGISAAVTVAVTMLASVTLLPAFLGFARERIEVTQWYGLVAAALISVALLGIGLGLPILILGLPLAFLVFLFGRFVPSLSKIVPRGEPAPVEETMSYRWSRVVQNHPKFSLLAGSALLLVLTSPVLSLRLGFSDEGNHSEDTTTRRAYDLLATGFGPGFNGPLLITAEVGDASDQAVFASLVSVLASADGVASVGAPIGSDPANPESSPAYVVQLVPDTAPQGRETTDLVESLRDDVIPPAISGSTLAVNVTGTAAANVDFTGYLSGRIVIFFGAVLTLSFLLLMMVFRSLLVPIKAVVMNLLSIGAAYGIVVAIFQKGWLGSVLGIEGAPIEPFIPMMMFAIVFGLSMDYEIFLLSRVKEAFDRSGDPVGSVADGLASTARVITAAAAIMVVIFGSFVFEDDRITKLFGLGLAVAVLLDATVVRMLLVPATMELLGRRNWWLPPWLDRLLPVIQVEAQELPAGSGDGGGDS